MVQIDVKLEIRKGILIKQNKDCSVCCRGLVFLTGLTVYVTLGSVFNTISTSEIKDQLF